MDYKAAREEKILDLHENAKIYKDKTKKMA
jgi:hypothetical protein